MSTIVPGAWAQVSLTTINSPYTQDFNTLASTGTTNTTLPTGFTFVETGTSARVNNAYAVSTGSDGTADIYSFGTAAADRAFGGLRSGTLIPVIGASFINNTGTTITSLSITYTGEQWRLGTTGRVDRLDFQYSTTATNLSTGTYIDVDALDFAGPTTTGTTLDGNASANRTTITSTITGLSIASGATFWIRYNDLDASGADDGLAIDDFSLTPIAVVCPAITASLNGTTTICTGSSTNLTATITGGTGTYSLTYSNGTSNTVVSGYTSGANISVNPTTNTTYTIVAATDANACPATVSGMGATVTVNQNPAVSMAGASQTITAGNTATLAANTPTTGTGSWSVTSGPSTNATQFSSTANPAATFTPDGGVGNYVLTWTISNAPCTPSASSLTITVNAATPVCPQSVTNITTGETFCTIQAAIDAPNTLNGHTITVAAVTYDELVTVSKSLTINGQGTASNVTFTGTVPGSALASLFTVAAANVAIQNLGFTVDLSKTHSAIHTTGNDRSNLRVIGNVITATGTPGLPYGRRNAIAINPNISGIPGYTLDNDGFPGVVVQTNTVTAGSSGLSNSFRAAVQIDLCGGTVGGATGNLGNTLTAINHDVISVFTNQGDLTIQNNICGGGGIQLSDPNPNAGTITIANNTLNGGFVQPTSGALGTGALMRIRNNGISGVKPLFIQNNTFQNHRWGISAENNGGISITGNTFTPNPAATDFRHISVNSKVIASNSASLTDAQMQTLSGTLTGNTFNGTSTPGSGTAIAFLNHRTAGAKFGPFTLGSTGSENTFAAGIGTFIRLDNSTGASAGFVSPFNDYAGIPATDMGPWAQDYNIRANRFDVGSGPQLPGTMTAMQRAALETKLFHKPDDASVGQLLYFDPVRNLTQNISYQTIGAAITAANANDVIQLDEFTFNERVTIDKPLSLTGVSKTNSIIDGTGLAGTGSGIAIASGVTNVTIRNLTVQKFAGSNPNTNAGIFGALGNSNLLVDNVQSLSNVGGSGFYANGPVQNVTVTNSTVSGHTNVAGAARGIVVWNGFKQNITITNNTVSDNNCCGIELQDGTASGVTITGNTLLNNGDNGIGVVGLKAGAGPNLIANNVLNTNGRFGIEIKNPNGTGLASGDGSIVVENNNVSFTASAAMNNRDHAGISVYRRAVLPNNTEGYPDVPTGVVVRNNTVSGYQHLNQVSAPTESEGFGIVIEGTNHTVSGNTLTNNNIGIQQQGGGHPNANYVVNNAGDGDQAAGQSPGYFGRGNSPLTCGNTVGGNTFSGNTTDTRNAGPGVGRPELVRNINTNAVFCTIQAAVDAATAGQSLSASAGTFTENVTIPKSLTLLGANAGVSPTGTRIAETIVLPATAGAIDASATKVSVFNLTGSAANVVIDGFTLDGANPALSDPANGLTVNGVDIDAATGVRGSGAGVTGGTVRNNIIKNFTFDGVLFSAEGTPTFNTVSNNSFDNIAYVSATTAAGHAVLSASNGYVSVINNTATRVRTGVQTNNFSQPSPGGVPAITGNTFTTYRYGVFHNLHFQSATGFVISNNTITGDAPLGSTTPLAGIALSSIQSSVPVTVSGNTVNAGFPYGIESWNTPTTGDVTVSGGSVQGSIAGVRVTNRNRFGDGTGSKLLVIGVTISNSPTGVLAFDDPAAGAGSSSSVVVTGNTQIGGTGAFTAVAISGPDASASIISNASSFLGNGSGVGVDVNGGKASVNTNRIGNFATGINVTNGGQLTGAANNFITGSTTSAVAYAADASPTQGVVTNNDLSGSTNKAIINGLTNTTIDATCNWYGTTAPASSLFTGLVMSTPFLVSGTDNEAGTPGFQPVPGACTTPLALTFTASPTMLVTTGTTTLSAVVAGGTPPYSYSFTGPGTIAASGNTATVSGLPAGVQTFTVVVSDAASQTITGTVSVTVTAANQPPVAPTFMNQTGTVAVAFSYTVPAFTDPESQPLTYQITGLPAGLTADNTTRIITGTPTTTGASTVTVVASDPQSATTAGTFLITINANQPPVASAVTNQTATVGVAFSYTVPAFSDPESQTLAYTATGVPAPLMFDPATRVVSGTPSTTGVSTITITATDPASNTASATFTLTVNPAPVVVTSLSLTASATPAMILTTGTTTLSATASGGTTPYSYAFAGPGTISPSGNTATVSGLMAGVQTFTVTATDSTTPASQTISAIVSVTVNQANMAPVATANANQTATVGTAFSYTVNAFTDETPNMLTYTASINPANGFSFNPTTRVITGTPSMTGVSNVTITATDPGSLSASTMFTITVSASAVTPTQPATLTITSFTCNTTNSMLSSVNFVVGYSDGTFMPALPDLFINGVTITGRLGQTFTFGGFDANTSFLPIQDNASRSTYFVWDFRTACAAPVTPPAATPPVAPTLPNQTATQGSFFSYVVPPFTGTQPIAYAATGLPTGLSFDAGSRTISGTPSMTGVSTVVISASNSAGQSSGQFTITVNAPATPPTGPAALTITSFNCFSTNGSLNSVNFVVGYSNGTFTPALPDLFINGVTITGQLGQQYTFGGFDANASTLPIQDNASRSTYFVWNFRTACASQQANGRRSAESVTPLHLRVLGNPVGNLIDVEIAGAEGGSLTLTLTDALGRTVGQHSVEKAVTSETVRFDVGNQPAGVLLLRATTPTQTQTLRVLKGE